MHRRISAGPRRRTRRALLAAALPVALAAVALPSAAHAATAEVNNATPNGVLGYFAADGEVNNVRVSVSGTKLVISDGAPITARNGCTLNAQGDAECPIGVDQINLLLRDKNDVVQYAAPHRASVGGEDGDDIVFGGLRQAVPGRSIQPVFYFGGAGRDTSRTASPIAACAWTPPTTRPVGGPRTAARVTSRASAPTSSGSRAPTSPTSCSARRTRTP
jgi:hypothetical protein